jgi:diguanylate cyclase (GGDEF)-like protein/PAS domain S-box-containing protein
VAAVEAIDYEVRFRVASGEYRWVALRTRPIRDDSGRVVGRVTGWRDIDVEHRARQALQASEVRYRLLAQNAMDLVFSLDVSAIIQWVSPSVTALLEYEPAELIGQFGAVLLHPDDLPILLDAATEARAGRPASCRIRMRSKSGQDRWVEATPRAIFDDERVIVGGVIGVRDIHDEVLTAQALEHEVAFDGLTGLAKRTLALERIQEILDTRKSPGWALLCVGVNGLTAVNQAFTYAAGDDVLRTVAKRLVQAAGAADRVARITGDEFVVMLRDVITSTDAGNAAERLLAATRGPVGVVDERFNVTCSVGIAVADGHDAQALLRDATAAMRQASSKGGDRWELLGADVAAETRHALSVQAALREALAVGEIEAWYMPIADIHDARVHGFEALVRWVHPDGTVTGPAEFLEIAERSNLIIAIDRLMIAKASLELAALPPDQHIAVNVSAATLSSGILEAAVRDALATTGVNPTRLHIEVTETALLDVTETMTQTMGSLAAFGISWWVDDFGTGFSSISHLRDLPVTGLKLDRSFTAGITKHDDHVARLTQGLAGLANGLRLATVAEGVETQEQASILAGQGWQLGQGWLYGRPQPMSAFR